MLRKIRITLSSLIFLLLAAFMLDFSGQLPQSLKVLAQLQFVPALIGINAGILIFLVLLSLLFGRIYCSAICPLGYLQDIVNRVAFLFQKKKRFRYKKALTWLRWGVVAVTLLSFVFGFTFLVGLLDPYSAFGRITTHLFRPAYLAGNNLLELIFSSFGNHTFYKMSVYLLSVSSLVIALLTLLTVCIMSAIDGRAYCNTICPVGTTLGYLSKFSLLKVRIDNNKCNSCGTCGRKCKASCIDTKNHQIDYSRCVDCFDCIEVCSQRAMSFGLAVSKKEKAVKVDESKRNFLLAMGLGSVAAGKVFADSKLLKTSSNKAERKTPISPPGSMGHENLLSKCTSCHLCISKCPSHIIKPAFTEYGLGGIMQPVLSFEHGFCNYDCTLCTEICPSGALSPVKKEDKNLLQTGKVQFIRENCIVFTDETSCGACSEHCPTQAVRMVDYKDDLTIPSTDTSICVGCGGCEYICPAQPHKAIYVEGLKKHNKISLKKEKVEDVKVDDFGF